jgi:malonyl CoA-acyl carrier protein transacylase
MISKKELEEIQKWVDKAKQEEQRKVWRQGKIVLRCSTVAVVVSGALTGIGSWASDNFPFIYAAVQAFIKAKAGVAQ